VSESCEWKKTEGWKNVWDVGCDGHGLACHGSATGVPPEKCPYCGKPLVVKGDEWVVKGDENAG